MHKAFQKNFAFLFQMQRRHVTILKVGESDTAFKAIVCLFCTEEEKQSSLKRRCASLNFMVLSFLTLFKIWQIQNINYINVLLLMKNQNVQ